MSEQGPNEPKTLIDALALLKRQRQRDFVHEFMRIGFANATEAWMNINGKHGVTRKNATANAASLMRRPDVQLCIKIARQEANQKSTISVEKHLKELKEIRDQARKGAIQSTSKYFECKHCGKGSRIDLKIYQPDMKAAARAEELRGKAAGFYIEKSQVIVEHAKTPDQLAKELCQDTDEAVTEVVERLIAGEPMNAQRMIAIASRFKGAA